MTETCLIVRVLHPDKTYPFLEINASDFDPSKHTIFDAPLAVEDNLQPLPPPPPSADPLHNLSADWREADANSLKQLALAVGGRAVENKKQALEVIDAAISARFQQ
jgi:hypothetical protein